MCSTQTERTFYKARTNVKASMQRRRQHCRGAHEQAGATDFQMLAFEKHAEQLRSATAAATHCLETLITGDASAGFGRGKMLMIWSRIILSLATP